MRLETVAFRENYRWYEMLGSPCKLQGDVARKLGFVLDLQDLILHLSVKNIIFSLYCKLEILLNYKIENYYCKALSG